MGVTPTWKALGLLAALAYLASPVYVLPSGLPQPGDLLTVALIGLVLVANRGRFATSRGSELFVGSAAFLALYITGVSIAWVWITGFLAIAIHPMFYLYNVTVVLVALTLHARLGERFVAWLMHLTAGALVAQLLAIPLFTNGRVRETLFFNNPNQLAEYAIESACIFYACTLVVRAPGWYRVVVYVATALLVWVSVSRAAFAALVSLFVVLSWGRPALGVLVALTGVAVAAWLDLGLASILDQLGRVVDLSSGTNRGYDRILNQPQYLIFGAAEGVPQRFQSTLNQNELHSNYGTLLFSYGIVGSLLFTTMLYGLYRRAGLQAWLALVPPLILGLAHQGLRFTTLWILFATIAIVGEHRRDEPWIAPWRAGSLRRSPAASPRGAPRPAGSGSRSRRPLRPGAS